MASKVAEAFVEVRADTSRVGSDLTRAKSGMVNKLGGLEAAMASRMRSYAADTKTR